MMGHQWSSVQRGRRHELETQQSPCHIRQGRTVRTAEHTHVALHHRLIGPQCQTHGLLRDKF